MAKNKITIDIEVNGKMQKATVSAKKLRAALEGVDAAQDRVGKSARTTDRNIKGAAQASANATKNFSKMAQGLGGSLVPAYATLAANIFAVTAAFNAFKKAAQVEQLEANLIRVGNIAGRNLGGVAESLRNITGAAIDSETALRATAQGTAQNFSATQLQDLATIAKGASISLGRDLPDALDRLIRGTAKLEPEILDELGIIVRLDDATRDYAESLGKTSAQLTTFERQQAFANAVSEQGLKKFGEVARTAETNPFDKLAASFSDLQKKLFQILNDVFEPFVEFLSINDFALSGAILTFGSTIINQLTPALSDMAEAGRDKFNLLAEKADAAAKAIETEYGNALKNLETLEISPKGFKEVEASIRAGTAGSEDFKKALKSLSASETKRVRDIEQLKKAGVGLRGAERSAHLLYVEEKERELELIKQQILATQTLADIEESGIGTGIVAGSAREANNAGVRARQSGIEADALSNMQVGGLFEGLSIASEASRELFEAAEEAEGGLERLRRTGTAAGGSIRLMGSAFLRFIPYVGLAMIAFDLLKGAINLVFDSPFEDSPLQKAIKESIENMEKMQQAAIDTQAAMLAAGSATERAFISMRAGTGFVEQVSGEFTKLSKKIQEADNERVARIKKEMSGELWFYESREVGRGDAIKEYERRRRQGDTSLGRGRDYEPQIAAIKQELREAALKEAMGGQEGAKQEDYLKQLNAARNNLLQLAEKGISIAPSALSMLDEEIDRVDDLGEGVIVAGKEILQFGVNLDKSLEGIKRFLNAFDEMGEVVIANELAFDKFVAKSATKFTPLLETSEKVTGVFKTLVDNFPEEGMTSTDPDGTKRQLSLLEAINASDDKAAIAFAERLSQSDKYKQLLAETNSEQEALLGTQTYYNDLLIAADESQRNLNAKVKENKVLVDEASRFSKESSAFLKLETALRADGISLQEKLLQNEVDYLATQKQTEEVKARSTDLENEIIALGKEKELLLDNELQQIETKFNETKRIVDIESKLTKEIEKQQALRLKMQEQQMTAELRAERESYGSNEVFEFLDRGRFEIQQKINLEERKLAQLLSKNQTEIDNQKKTMIKAEYTLLRAQLKNQIDISRLRATEMLGDKDESNDDLAREMRQEAKKLEDLLPDLESAEKRALENVGLETEAKIAGVQAVLEELKASKTDLSDINVLGESIKDNLANGLTDAFMSIIDGTKSAKQAFGDMARFILTEIVRMTLRMLIFRAIAGFFMAPSDTSGIPLEGSFGVNNYDFVSNPGGQLMGRYGGVFSNGKKLPGYSTGGIARGPDAGYLATLHGTEAVVPLPNGREIPVQMTGNAGQNNVTVNVAVDNNGNAQTNVQNQEGQAKQLGLAISAAVQQELAKQKRAGGMLSPYGV